MTSQSDLEKKVISALDESNAELSQQAMDDIAQVRMNAIRVARSKKSRNAFVNWLSVTYDHFRQDVLVNNFKFAAPVAVAVFATVLVSYNLNESVPMIPQELLSGDIPSEELALLEDLEFASWLAEQQQEGHL